MKTVKLLFLLAFFITNRAISQEIKNQIFISTDKAIEDIEFLITTINEIHHNPYFKTTEEDFKKYKNDLLTRFSADSIPLKLFMSTGMKLVAKLSGGHTSFDWQNEYVFKELIHYKFIPFTGKLSLNETSFVVSNSAISEIKKGTQVKAINGINITDLFKECMSCIGGIASYRKAYCEKVFPIYLFFTNKLSSPYNIQLENINVNTAGLSAEKINGFLNENNFIDNYTFVIIKDDIGLISYNSCTDYDAFKVFLDQVFEEIKENNLDKLIIDIRENSGGDSSLNDLLLSYITKKPYRQSSGRYWKVSKQAKEYYKKNSYENHFGDEFMDTYYQSQDGKVIETMDESLIFPRKTAHFFSGETCFLIGPNTFSSANFLADAVKTYKLSTLIGSATGEFTNDFGEVLQFRLPNSGNYVYVSSTYDIGANANPNIMQPVFPDIKVENKVLEFAIKWLKGNDVQNLKNE